MITPTLAEIIREALESRLLDVHTCLPGKIISYDSSTRRADVELLLKRVLTNRDNDKVSFEEMPVLPDVPVYMNRGVNYFIQMPVETGTTGLVYFSEASSDQWFSTGQVSNPGDLGRHGLGNGFFIPGFFANSEVNSDPEPDALVIGSTDGTKLTIRNNGEIEALNDSGDFLLSPSGQFSSNGNFTVDP